MTQRSYKTDESFLEKLAIGAIGTQKVIRDLETQDQMPIELERGSTGYKIWKSIKIKRVRVPDILCVNSGIRIESRAKTNLVISMSHSSADETRGWDYGLKGDDYVALIVCDKVGDEPVDWLADDLVQYVSVSSLKETFRSGKVIQERPKGAQEGFESWLTWPAAVASCDGILHEVTSGRIKFKRKSDNRTISLSLTKKGIPLTPLIKAGESIQKNQIIASVVPAINKLPKIEIDLSSHYRELLESTSISDRYGAAKAFSHLSTFDESPLLERLEDQSEHIYVKLEAAASLARCGLQKGFEFIQGTLKSDYLEHRLEAVIILGEIQSETSSALLCEVLSDSAQHEEIRSGAAWALGELGLRTSISSLIQAFNEIALPIRVEAARALRKLCEPHGQIVLNRFKDATESERPGIAWALSRYDKWKLEDILKRLDFSNLDMKQWSAYIIGQSDSSRLIGDIEVLKDRDLELYFAVTVLWKITSSWVYDLREY